MSGLKAAGLIVAAGMSSRMGSFKPLLDLDGKPLICRTAESLLQGGAEQVAVVTGRNSAAVEQVLTAYDNVTLLHNADYETTAMFDSIKLGLQQLRQYDAILFLPGDVPCIRSETVRLLLQQWQIQRPDVLHPLYPDANGQSAQWHPPIISGDLIPALLQYDGPQGLKGALAVLAQRVEQLPVPDAGCTMDADYMEDYQKLCAYWSRRYYPDLADCQMFYQLADTPEQVQQHCIAVAQKALELGKALQQRGISLNLELLESAALLHDICRAQANHAAAGADFLRQYGLEQTADLVAVHMDWPTGQAVVLNEASLLYIADKLVSGDGKVSLLERFAQKEQRYHDRPEILANILQRKQIAVQILDLLQQMGITATELVS